MTLEKTLARVKEVPERRILRRSVEKDINFSSSLVKRIAKIIMIRSQKKSLKYIPTKTSPHKVY